MALQIWLPLTKDLRQQGLSNTTVGNTGATYSSTGGKLGGCYIFDGVDDALTIGNLSTLVDSEYSFACWFYHDDTWSSKSFETLFGGPSGFELEAKNSSTNSPVLRLYNWGGSTCTYELNKWNHVVFTRNTTETKLYLNGEPKLTGTAGTIPSGNYFVGSWRSTTGQNYKGKMCDVRIYDHCLSPMEVKELAKGLVLHYPLNRQGWGQENLLVDTYNWSTLTNTNTVSEGYWYSNGGTAVRGYDNINNITYCKIWHSDSSSWTRYSRQYITMQPNIYYTVSILCRINTDIAHLSIRNDRNKAITFFAQNVELTNKNWEWKFFTAQTHTNTSQEPFTIYAQLNSDGVLSSDTSIDIAMVKLEKSSVATPWCPNSSDALATTMGLNSTIEYDCSGFCNNGTKVGTLTYSSDTPKYVVSTHFNGSSAIKDTTFPFSSNQWTVAFWYKFTTTPTAYQGFICLSRNSGADADKKFAAMPNSNYIWFKFESISASLQSLKTNEWCHITVTCDGTNGRIYENGILKTTTGSVGTILTDCDDLVVGARASSSDAATTGVYLNGNMSDIRVYATALSASDVKSLYQNSAYIDSSGNVYGAVHTEV